jgi:hypothetical protein
VVNTPKPDISLEAQLKEAKREIALRHKCYPAWITAKRLNQFKAEDQLAAMEAIIRTLERVIAQSSPK